MDSLGSVNQAFRTVPYAKIEMSNTGEILEIVTYVAMCAFALHASPVAFAVGLGASVLSVMILPPLIEASKSISNFENGYLFPVMGDLLKSITFIGALIVSTKFTPFFRAALLPRVICTFIGYVVPSTIYNEMTSS
jgi:hypothetical protein